MPEPADFTIETTGLDPEISSICGPQLVVPVSNARYALNAANARWGSLYDALYGTDAISREGDLAPGKGYNPARAAAVFACVGGVPRRSRSRWLSGSHRDVTGYHVVEDGERSRFDADTGRRPCWLEAGRSSSVMATRRSVASSCCEHNGLHVEPDDRSRNDRSGKTHKADLADLVIESALTTIQDCEDSVAAVDAEDKVGVYRNWLGLMNGTLRRRSRRAARR